MLPAFFCQDLDRQTTLNTLDAHFCGALAQMGSCNNRHFLPNNQPQAAALGMVINNSEVDTPSTLTWMSTSDGKCYESSNRGGGKSVPHKIMDNFSQTHM